MNQHTVGKVLQGAREATNQSCLMTFEMTKDLYTYILHRIPKKLASFCTIVEYHKGFEVYRIISQEEDPFLESDELHITLDGNKMDNILCKDVSDTNCQSLMFSHCFPLEWKILKLPFDILSRLMQINKLGWSI